MADGIEKTPDSAILSNRRSSHIGADRRASSPLRIRRPRTALRPILIVEDEYVIAADLETQIREDGGRVARLAMSVKAAEEELRDGSGVAGVILDINIRGQTSFGLADALQDVGLPFVFYTGYPSIAIPDRFVGVPRIAKPAEWTELKEGLGQAQERILRTGLGSFRDSVEAALPALRHRARNLLQNPEDADQLVEQTLERAISAVGNRSLRLTIEDWLLSLLENASSDNSRRMLH